MIFTYSLFVLLNRNPEFGINESDLTNKICKYYFLKVYRFCTNAKSTRSYIFHTPSRNLPLRIKIWIENTTRVAKNYESLRFSTRLHIFECNMHFGTSLPRVHTPSGVVNPRKLGDTRYDNKPLNSLEEKSRWKNMHQTRFSGTYLNVHFLQPKNVFANVQHVLS